MHPALKATLFKGGDPTLLWDEDFANQVYRYNRVRYPAVTDLPATTFTRATTGYGVTAAGTLTSFASGAPRVTDAGLTVEAAATNLLLRSKNFTDSYWNQAVATITDNVALAPDGTMTAGKVVIANTTGARLATSITIAVTPSTTYALSGYVKAFAAGDVGKRLTMYIYDVAAGVFKGAKAITLAADWQRVETSFASGAGTTAVYATIAGTETGTNDTCSVLVWGAQLEAGSFATSYIPTTTAAVTRNADVLVTADTVISPTIVAEFTVPLARPSFAYIWQSDDGTGDTSRVVLFLDRGTGKVGYRVEIAGVAQAAFDVGSVTPGATYRVAARTAINDFAASINGAACIVDTSGALPTVTTFRIGRGNGTGQVWGSGIRKIKRYSVAKTNAELQALST